MTERAGNRATLKPPPAESWVPGPTGLSRPAALRGSPESLRAASPTQQGRDRGLRPPANPHALPTRRPVRRGPRPRPQAQFPTARRTCKDALPRAGGGRHFPASFLKLFMPPPAPSTPPPEGPALRATSANRKPVCSITPPLNRTGPAPLTTGPPPILTAPCEMDTCLRQLSCIQARSGPSSNCEASASLALAPRTGIWTATGIQDPASQGRILDRPWQLPGGTFWCGSQRAVGIQG